MKVSQQSIGRIFTIRLDDGEQLTDSLERFALERGVLRGFCIFVGGARDGGKIVAGPEKIDASGIVPIIHEIKGAHETLGVGTLFPDSKGVPRLHAHAALGRDGQTATGCVRTGIQAWKILEIIVVELAGNRGMRIEDSETGLELLDPEIATG